MMSELHDQLTEAVSYLQAVGPNPSLPPRVGLVLGSGWGRFADDLDDLIQIGAARVPHLPVSTVPGHAGNVCFGTVGVVPVACLQGRIHLYEGYSPQEVVFGVLLLAALGCRAVLLTNAAGGIADHLEPGDLMLISDHLNLTGISPLVGPNRGPYPRFPDLSAAYDPHLAEACRAAAHDCGVSLKTGVYAAMLGPSYETPAEVRMLRTLGADAVGMSTVAEVIALRHRDIPVGAISLITNHAAGLAGKALSHAEVVAMAQAAGEKLVGLLRRWTLLAGGMVEAECRSGQTKR